MFLLRRTRGLVDEWIPSSFATSYANEINSSRGSRNSSAFAFTESAPERCLICEQKNASFSQVSPWDDSATPPAICIACVERSLSIAETGDIGAHPSPKRGFQAPPRGNDSNLLICWACYRQLLASDFPDGYIVESCQHEPNICLDCIEKSIIESLDIDLPQIIGCPQCGNTMSAIDIWRLSGVKTFER